MLFAHMTAGTGSKKHQKGAQAFTAGVDDISRYLVDESHLAV